MMARLTLKDENGIVTLDLSKSVCRFLTKYEYRVDARSGNVYDHQPPLIVDLGKAADKDKFWYYVPHGAVRYGLSREYFLVSAIAVEIATKSELASLSTHSGHSALVNVIPQLKADRVYLVAYDARIYNHNSTQAAVIYVGTR